MKRRARIATVIAAALAALDLYSDYAIAALLLGFWLVVLMFGTGIRRFLNEPEESTPLPTV